MHTYAQVFYRRYLIASPFVRLDLTRGSIDESHLTPAELMTLDGHPTLDGQPQCSYSRLIWIALTNGRAAVGLLAAEHLNGSLIAVSVNHWSGRTMIEQPPHVEPSTPLADGEPNGKGSVHVIHEMRPRLGLPKGKRPTGRVIAGAISLLAILAFVPSWIQKWLWMRQVGYSGVFWRLFSVRWELFGAAFVVALLYLWINFRFAAQNGATFRVSSER
jgi:hypothetical protein